MSGKLRRLYRQAMSPWGVAPGGGTPGVKQLPLKGTGEARGKPPRRRAWLRKHTVSTRSDERPTGNPPPAPIPCLMGQRAHPKVRHIPADGRGWLVYFTIPKHVKDQPVLPLDRSGFRKERIGSLIKSPPTCLRRVHHGERGRPRRGGVPSPKEAHGRRRPHSSQSTGKPRTGRRGPACWDVRRKITEC